MAVGTVLALLQGGGGATGRESSAGRSQPAEPAPPSAPSRPMVSPPAAASAQRSHGLPPGHRPRISPRARKRARELGVDIAAIPGGSGVDGSIDVADVEAAAAATAPAVTKPAEAAPAPPASAPAAAAAEPASRQARLRSVIAAAMSRSKREIPHYYLEHTFDLDPALGWLEQANRERPITERILPNVLLLKAMADALDTVPELNGFWIDGSFQQQEAVHLGVAISLRGGGVLAPALHDVQDKPLDQLMVELSDLVRRARAGKLRHREMTDGTITVTSLGDRGTDTVLGVIFPPQVALVGFGTVAVRPWVVDGDVVPRRVVTATLSADHRASDGHRGALFLRALADRLQEPETL